MPVIELGLEEFVRRLHARLTDDRNAEIVWFLGAGCSMSSGIKGASELVEDWVKRCKKFELGNDDDWQRWAATKFEGFDCDNLARSYGAAIEALFKGVERDRQQEVETLTAKKDPAVGYALLARLMAHAEYGARANVALTTNFDDLLADALYLLTDQKPLVVVHDSLAPFVRSSQSRPLIVKLHGDARLAPRNTAEETDVLDEELRSRLALLLQHCALLFCGYGGNDDSIAKLIASAPRDAMELGIFWVGSALPTGAMGAALDERARVFHVPHQDFDRLMLTMAEVFGLELPEEKRFKVLFEGYRAALTRSAATSDVGSLEREAAGRLGESIDAWTLATQADALESSNPVRATELYEQAVAAGPTNSGILGNFAIFLENRRGDFDRAETFYERAMEADPTVANNPGNFAIFLENRRGDFDRAEAFYEQATTADPTNGASLGNFALFLESRRGDFDRAEAFYERATTADPVNANNLSNFALFLENRRGDFDRAEAFYERATTADPANAATLGNFALFLENRRGDFDRAEAFYERAMTADPANATNLSNFAHFLQSRRGEVDRAEALHLRAIAGESPNGNALANYSQLLFGRGDDRAARDHAERALSADDATDPLRTEVNYYRYVHVPDDVPTSLAVLKALLAAGARSPDWSFALNLERAERDGDPRLPFLRALAAVIADGAPLDTLDAFPEWTAA